MLTRTVKIVLVAALAFIYALIVFNNLTDFGSNFEFVRHVLSMDTTFPGNHGMWRALPYPGAFYVFYLSIIAWEMVNMILFAWGAVNLVRARRAPIPIFHAAKRVPIIALTLSLLMWLVAFLAVGGEWFLMWQSHTWNGQEEAFRMFVVVGIVLLLLLQPENETQP